MKKLTKYLSYDYPVRVFRYPDGMYCAEVESIEGLCAYGKTREEALKELDDVKVAAFELMLSQGKEPPAPTVRLEIPANVFQQIPNRRNLSKFVKV